VTPRSRTPGRPRPGYTLLEVILALGIGVLLLGALYVALDVQMSSTHTGREIVEQNTVARHVLNRLHNDIASNLGPIDPKLIRNQNSSAATTTPSTTTPSTTTPSTTTNQASSTTPTEDASTPPDSATGPLNFNLMVQGSDTVLVLYVSRANREVAEGEPACDLRRITYWLAGGLDAPLGLARHEVKDVTCDAELNVLPPNVGDEAGYVIAPQVLSVSFEYFDGSAWYTEWDGSQLGEDMKTPVGPPNAIAIALTVARPARPGRPLEERSVRTYRHVVAILAANGTVTVAEPTEPTEPETSGSTTPSTTTGGTQP
jgi:hypothetical protein